MPAKPDYGVDAPGVIRNLLLIGLALLIFSYLVSVPISSNRTRFSIARTALITGGVCLLEGLAMLAYSKLGKFRHRDRMLAKVNWRGNEQVLDVGTGRGLLLIGAAKRLTSGRAAGIDIWSGKDLSGNSMEATLRNAELEGVANSVELKTEDASAISFPDASFDVVLSNLCLHNLPSAAARRNACFEIARVLKPEGTAVLSDYKNAGSYARAFVEAGLKVRRFGPYVFSTFPPLTILVCHR
jgi:arsenite methyltransferase